MDMRRIFLLQIILSACYVWDAAFIRLFGIPFYLLTLLYFLCIAETVGFRMMWKRLVR
jgi:hypothetical protein